MIDFVEQIAYLSESGRIKYEVHWHKFRGKKSIKFTTGSGKEIVLKPGDVYGAQEYSKTQDIISFPDNKWRFKLDIANSEKLMERSVLKKVAKVVIEPLIVQTEHSPKSKIVKPLDKSKVIKPQKIVIEPTDEELDKKYGARVTEPFDEIDDITEDEIRSLLNSISRSKNVRAPKV